MAKWHIRTRRMILRYNPGVVERFRRNILDFGNFRLNDCWTWSEASRTPDGYGLFSAKTVVGHLTCYAHHVAYVLQNGKLSLNPIIDIAHGCDNTWCVNPTHLNEESHATNLDERNWLRQVILAVGFKPKGIVGSRQFLWDGWNLPEYNETMAAQFREITALAALPDDEKDST